MSQRPDKALPLIPRPSFSVLRSIDEESEDEAEAIVLSTGMPSRPVTPNTTRREYALLELLRSERTYASDLILLRDFQIPLASGRLSSMSSIWPAVDATICQYLGLESTNSNTDVGRSTPPGSSSVASRPLTTASNISAVSFGSIFTLRPMKTKDVNIVFSNIEELAAFTEGFLDRLESALGQLIEGNEGEDSVGKLFLESIAQMEPLYSTYIMNQPNALEHYRRLSETFQFDIYLPRSQILAHKSSNAWDLPSLLIKPVQRLLHYPQLLAAIIAETTDSHRDKLSLVEAHARIAEMARDLNGRWRQRVRRQKVVQEVLAIAGLVDTPPTGSNPARPRRRSGLKIGLAASMNLGRIIAARPGADKAREGPEGHPEAQAIKAGRERLKKYEEFMATFTRETTNWVDAMRDFVGALEDWAHAFAKVVFNDPDEECPDAWQLFAILITDLWSLVHNQLKAEIGDGLVRTINCLKDTIAAPMCLLEEMQRLEPLFCDFLSLNVAKSRPSPSLLEASESYVALRELLSEELPMYLTLLDKGMTACMLKFTNIQWQFYSNVRNLWTELWDTVKVDGEMNHGIEETLRVWWGRFSEVDKQLKRLNIIQPQAREKPTLSMRRRNMLSMGGAQAASNSGVSLSSLLAALDPMVLDIPTPEPTPSGYNYGVPHNSKKPSTPGGSRYPSSLPSSPSPGRCPSSDPHLDVDIANSGEPNDTDYTRRPRSESPLEPSPSHLSISPRTPKKSNLPPSTRRRRKSVVQIPQTALYDCRVLHPCQPPRGVNYRALPFFTLVEDEVYEILAEAGHPSTHPDLPLYVDDSEDCLMLMRNATGDVGWGLASFLLPVDESIARLPPPSSESQGMPSPP